MSTLSASDGNNALFTGLSFTYNVGGHIAATTKIVAQSITPAITGNVQRLDLYGLKVGTPGDITIYYHTLGSSFN